jgi:hypothetical protein
VAYKINDETPLYKQLDMPEAIVNPYQRCIDGLMTGRTLNMIGTHDFERHINKIINHLLRLKRDNNITIEGFNIDPKPARVKKNAGVIAPKPAGAKKSADAAFLI